METAAKVFVVGGVLSLAYGFLLGAPLSAIRMKRPAASRHLVTSHLAAIVQGAMHLGLSVAVGFSQLGETWELAAAIAVVTGSALFVTGTTLNWLQDAGDHFAERTLGWHVLSASAMLNVPGIAILVVGVTTAL